VSFQYIEDFFIHITALDLSLLGDSMLYALRYTAKNNPTVFVGLLAFFVALWGVSSNRRASRHKNSIDFQTNLSHNEKILEMREIALSIALDEKKRAKHGGRPGYISISDYVSPTLARSKNGIAIMRFLNEWERAANGIFKDVYDEHFLYQVYGTTVLGIYELFYDYISSVQQQNPRAYLQYSKLYCKWRAMRIRQERKTGQLTKLKLNDKTAAIELKKIKKVQKLLRTYD